MFGNMFFVLGELAMLLILGALLVAYGLIPATGGEHKRPKDQPRDSVQGSFSGGKHRAPHIRREA